MYANSKSYSNSQSKFHSKSYSNSTNRTHAKTQNYDSKTNPTNTKNPPQTLQHSTPYPLEKAATTQENQPPKATQTPKPAALQNPRNLNPHKLRRVVTYNMDG